MVSLSAVCHVLEHFEILYSGRSSPRWAHPRWVSFDVVLLAPVCFSVAIMVRDKGECRTEEFFLLFAVRANSAAETLSRNENNAGGDKKRFDPHVDQSCHGSGRVVGMERAQHHLPGQRCLDRDIRRLRITDLADHDDVRTLP